ncbi:alcohol dehydrogenase catalytic domain-containing protein [Streptomyces ipomoeae]|jgi:alcohol dehydrogenase|uniref:Oxidoreductase, zinc-binding dehydrogenase family protein n=1 Tax=Streptomyces ipomoeae 91-03 TaxID=698759 RepID=L1KTE1_9ACTN|nr:alcohol dehydrogenase catalytic domain-containing protein [Streptomyces ipomoeae]EKX64086.1 oxidoreductase, zinc-binding dehydrogenase family protein [Streptomyces ipomoeae 91-03]MDX2691945.1 alcohol dehydrogenase catalytic domain-containing protein [Streptomyces ipomoeae]MDX2820328.1 alcohol dehydrogenase catalytic domain-containing protein [Streptomyces ipomoeae]MDX2837452.1 alcohol dehydrogenase catalytic domain-containing protein [Streptomyces ipomoeae]MDX2872875.1 alcohol dehydrogenase
MRALVYHSPGQISWDTVTDPGIEDPADAVVRVDATTVCGTDLHILRGDLPEVKPGTVLGHEAVGEVLSVGHEVHSLTPGDQVIVSSVSACGRCEFCRDSMLGQCHGGGGWILGNLVNGTQAEFVWVPFADYSARRRPDALALSDAVLLAEVLPTAYEVGVRNGHVGPGDTVVVVGAGPVGLAAAVIARLYSPRRVIVTDLSAARLEAALRVGADAAELPGKMIADLSEGPGADVVIEASGEPEGFVLCTRAVRTGGHIANIGTHGKPVTLHLEALWRKNVMISTGQVDTSSTPWLLELVRYGRLHVSQLVTHSYGLDRMEDAYDVFAHGTSTGALKVVLQRG